MTQPQSARDSDYRLYRQTADTYDTVRFSGRAGEWGHVRQVTILRSMVDDWKHKRVLEIGCGTGRITEELTRLGACVTATDIAAEMLDVARKRIAAHALAGKADFRLMSVYDIDVDLGAYELIIAINVFGRLFEPATALRNIASGLSEKGRFVFTFPCLTSILAPFGMIVNLRGKSLSRNVPSRWHTPRSIERQCRDAGLAVTGWKGNHYVPVPRRLFPLLPLFQFCDFLLSRRFPKRCPSVFAECVRAEPP